MERLYAYSAGTHNDCMFEKYKLVFENVIQDVPHFMSHKLVSRTDVFGNVFYTDYYRFLAYVTKEQELALREELKKTSLPNYELKWIA